ncbi:hypothetical protein G6F70_001696 [Rhizopus microsporus]|uniref:F-box domain-containing protein n=2 Tax=Rhizopus TaxID=4842 RepID=A0A367J6W3_RHIAZ|nr:hypothetical protein G6F71_001722 [Rhizopus microsporus]RCH85694.1 hypothetical protein CU097_008452 [Rhizopus azygosporus]KAG1203078.1 hypothetical protein G6F70_001696 [Rhizopus microsporus]KAG1215378.1 hypothetical protein G6F69_001053 [Rhizopus microsporus]ORE23479.1 hypothetical protein BCV71DRAFT_223959 [Rhizopus microsporus]
MSNWKELPAEILCEIFKQIRSYNIEHHLVECQLVCKNWRKYASFIFYRELSFRTRLQVKKFIKCMQNSSLGSAVQEIAFWCDIYDTCSDYNEKIILLIYKLAETCPNVEIFKCNLHSSHLRALVRAVESYWKQLKQVPEPQWFMSSDLNISTNYYALTFFCHRTLTHLTLPPTYPFDPEFKRFMRLLPFYINLTHLTVTPGYSNSTIMDFDETIQQCPNLTCFTIQPCLIMTAEIAPDYTKRRKIFTMEPHLKLKKLVADTNLHQDTLDYIMHKFPNLECCNLFLSIDQDHAERIEYWISMRYPKQLRKFQEYLSGRRCDWFFAYASFPLIEEYLQHSTDSVVRISSTKRHYPSFHMKQGNITWIIRDTREDIDRLTRIFEKHQGIIKKAYLDMSEIYTPSHQLQTFFLEWKGLEEFNFNKSSMDVPVSEQILNPSLTTLRLTAKHLSSEVLSAYSFALPELRNLIIETSYWFGGPSSLVVDMPKTKFNHLKIHISIGSSIMNMLCSSIKEALDKPVLLEILSQKSGQKQFLASTTLLNQVEEVAMATNKEYGYSIAIKCISVDFISVSFNKMHVLERYPLSL